MEPDLPTEPAKLVKIITVIPIARGIGKETLSYFTSIDVALGSLVSVPVRKKMVNALVVEKEEVANLRSHLKTSTYSVKKAEKLQAFKFLSPEFIESCEETAAYFATTTGAVLNALIPKDILAHSGELKTESPQGSFNKTHEKLVMQAPDEERFVNYKSLIREEFARKSSVFLCLPTIEDIKKAESTLKKGIENYTFVLHGSLKKKELISLWNKIIEETHSLLIIATPSFLCLPRNDIGTIIVDRENSRVYRLQSRPYLDARVFAEILAKKTQAKILYGDMLLRTETIWRQKNDEYAELVPLKFRSLTTAETALVDMKEKIDVEKKEFHLFSPKFEEMIRNNKDSSEHLFIFGARRGLAPTTVCGDCGETVLCNTCHAPTVLHKKSPTENFFLCHVCGETRSAAEKCVSCTSWKLVPLGIGIEHIEEEFREKFPDIQLFRIDTDSVSTEKKALEIVAQFYNTPGSVLLGTEMAIVYLDRVIEAAGVVSIDSLFSVPDFRIHERIMYLLLKIRALAQKKFILQTRNSSEPLLQHALRGNLADFYRSEIEQRKEFNYPPFTTLIKITLQGPKDIVQNRIEKLKEMFASYTPDAYPALTAGVKGKYTMHLLIKISRDTWVDKELLAKLRSLPPQYLIKVDPENIL